jgi:ribonuclease HI
MRIYTDGSGNGRYAWCNEDTGEARVDNITFEATNNEVEYWAVLEALSYVVKSLNRRISSYGDVKAIEIWSDSMLVVRQLTRECNVKDEKMRSMAQRIWFLINRLKALDVDVSFQWVRRKYNKAGKMLIN